MTYVASVSQDATFDAGGTAVTFAFDAGSTADRVILIHVNWRNANGHTMGDTAVTFNGVALAPLGATVTATQNSNRLYLLAGPASGSNTVSVDPSAGAGSSNAIINVVVYDTIDQVTPQDGYATANGTDSSAELTITSEAGDTPVYFSGWRALTPVLIAPTNYTERWDNVNSELASGGGEGVGDTSVAFVATLTATAVTTWVAMGCNLNAAAASGAVPGGYYQQYYRSMVSETQ